MRRTLSESSLSPSEGNVSLGVSEIEIDDRTSQLSLTEAACSEASQADSQLSDTSHACIFNIQFNTLKYRGKLLQNVQYRPRNKRVLNTNAKISWVYQHGADIQANGYQKLWLCKLCHTEKSSSSQLFNATSTSSIISHLDKVHGITEPSRNSSALSPSNHPQPFDDLKYKKQVVNIFIKNDLSFALVEDAEFRDALVNGRPEIEAILPSSHNTIKAWVLDYFTLRKIQIKDKVSRARSKINISLDSWRAPTIKNYIAICGHFIDEDCTLVHCLLGFKDTKGVKAGEMIAGIIAKVIDDYEVSQNLGSFMMDNAGDNDTMLKELATRFDIDVDFSRLRCLGHIINLVIQALLLGKGVSKLERKLAGASYEEAFRIWNSTGPIGKLHNICVYVNNNEARLAMFIECQGEEIQIYQLLVDGGIRWHSTEAMISRGIYILIP